MAKSPHLVSDYLEDLLGKILEDSKVVEDFVGGRPGIYALYSMGSLYYVGLATDLKKRLNQHKKDRHAGKWDRFSVFITTQDDHLKDLESLLLRVTKKPLGNRVYGKFVGAKKRNAELKHQFELKQKADTNNVFNLPSKQSDPKAEKGKKQIGPWALRAFYKNETHKALLRKDGTIRFDNQIFSSLSAAAHHLTGHPTNGQWFWWIKDHTGKWVRFKQAK